MFSLVPWPLGLFSHAIVWANKGPMGQREQSDVEVSTEKKIQSRELRGKVIGLIIFKLSAVGPLKPFNYIEAVWKKLDCGIFRWNMETALSPNVFDQWLKHK